MRRSARRPRGPALRRHLWIAALLILTHCGDGAAPLPVLSELTLVADDDPTRFATCNGTVDDLRLRIDRDHLDGARLHYDGVFVGGVGMSSSGDEPIPSRHVTADSGEIALWFCEPTVAWVFLDVTVQVELADGRHTEALRGVLPRPDRR